MTDLPACPQCSHPTDLHSMLAANNNPMNGGVVLCPVYGCPCFTTFGTESSSLTESEISRFRTAIQTGEM